jgi:N-acyl-D-amino-acid deacylase
MKAGCIGLSVGLAYEGQNRIDTPSLINLAGVLASYTDRWSGICWHMRDQSEHLLKAVAEVVRVHEATGVPCHISHLKRNGLEHLEDIYTALAAIEQYPGITADMYPYVEAWTLLAFPISTGKQTLGKGATTEDLATAGCRMLCPNLWADVVLVSGVADDLLGKSVEEVGAMLGKDGLTTFMRLHEEYPNATACYMNQAHSSNIEVVLKCKNSLVASDGHVYGSGEHGHHPRAFGTFSRFFAYCRDRQWMSEEEAIRKITSRPAERFGLAGRGRILSGFHADLCLFHSDRFRDSATFTDSNALSEGMEIVFINGTKAYVTGCTVSKSGNVIRTCPCGPIALDM